MQDDDAQAAHHDYCNAIWSSIMATEAAMGAELQRRRELDMRFIDGPAPSPRRPPTWAEDRRVEMRAFDGAPF